MPALLLLGCSDADAPHPFASESATPTTPVPTLSADDLAGEYRVAGIDGSEVAGDMGIALSIRDGIVSYEPRCLGFVWTLEDAGQEKGASSRLAITRRPGLAEQSAGNCQLDVTPAFLQLASALDAVDRAVRTPSNGIELTGDGRAILLFSQ